MKLASLVRNVCSRQRQPIQRRLLHQAHRFYTKRRYLGKPKADENVIASTMCSVVRIFTINRTTSLLHPWSASASQKASGSGYVISGRLILTNAHVVSGCYVY